MQSLRGEVEQMIFRAGRSLGVRGAPLLRSHPPRQAGRMTLERFRARQGSLRMAHEVALRIAHGERRFPLVFLAGQPGSGKTHLLWGIAQGLRRRQAGASAFYVCAGRLKVLGLRAAREGWTDRLERALVAFDALLVDGLEDLAAGTTGQKLLARVLDWRRVSRRVAVVGGRLGPFQLPLEERLQDRLAAGLVLTLEPARALAS